MPHVSRFSIAPVSSLGLEHPDADRPDRGRRRRGSPLLPRRRPRTGTSTGSSSGPSSRSARTPTRAGPDCDSRSRTGRSSTTRSQLGEPIETPTRSPLVRRARRRRTVGGAALGVRRPPDPAGPLRPTGRDAQGQPREPRLGWVAAPRWPARSASQTVDARRFRMLIDLEGASAHEEDDVGRAPDRARGDHPSGHEARRPLRDHDPGSRQRDPRPRHPPRRSSPTAGSATASTPTSGSWPTSTARAGSASATRSASSTTDRAHRVGSWRSPRGRRRRGRVGRSSARR